VPRSSRKSPQSGLRGRGGAGFPTGIKWKTVHDANATQKYIVCNADEGDSGTFADRMLMEGDPFLLIEGMAIAAIAVGATRGYIYLRSEYPHAHKALQRAILRARNAGVLGASVLGSAKAFELGGASRSRRLYLRRGDLAAGEPGRQPRPSVGRSRRCPALQGPVRQADHRQQRALLRRGADWILTHGAGLCRDYGMGRSRGTLPVQLAGNVKHGGLIELAFGISLREIIEDIGGGTLSGRPIRAVQVGGPLGAYLTESQLDTPMDYEALAGIKAMLGHGGVVVFDDSVDMASASPLRLRVLRQGELRQVHALPHRRDTRCRVGRQDRRRHRAAEEPRGSTRPQRD
jgi:formate dehydrogenase iron-sulfur subunit